MSFRTLSYEKIKTLALEGKELLPEDHLIGTREKFIQVMMANEELELELFAEHEREELEAIFDFLEEPNN